MTRIANLAFVITDVQLVLELTRPHRLYQCVSWNSGFRHWLSEVGAWPLAPVAGSPESCVV
jgi:hypothetical protein